MRKTFERELPTGYGPVFSIDAADKKIGLKLNLIGGGITIVIVALAFMMIRPSELLRQHSLSRSLLFLGTMLVYIVLHELTHGAAYKLLTGEKLTFGMSATVAYCGVPHIFVYRTAAMISLLAPFCVFSLVFGVPMLLLPEATDRFLCAVLLAVHAGGCVGDLYDTGLYLFRFRSPETLMQDTGPRQTFYLPGQ